MSGANAKVGVDFLINRSQIAGDVTFVKNVYSGLRKDMEKKVKFTGFTEGMRAAGTMGRNAMLAIGAAVGFTVKKFAEADKAASGLKTALAATGQETDGNYKALSGYAQALSEATVYTKAQIESEMTFATNLGVTADRIDAVTQQGIGLAHAFGKDLNWGIQAATLAEQQQYRQLKMFIPALRDVHSQQKLMTLVNERATAGFKEAREYTHTYAGEIENLRKKVDSAEKVIGGAFAPAINKVAGLITYVTDAIEGMTPAQKESMVYWTEMALGISAGTYALSKIVIGFQTFGKVFKSVLAVLNWAAFTPTGLVVTSIAALGALFVEIFGKGTTFGEKFADVWGKIQKEAVKAADFIKRHWEDTADAIVYMYYSIGKAGEDEFKQYVQERYQARLKSELDEQKARSSEIKSQKKQIDDKLKLQKSGHHREQGENEASHQDIQKTWFKLNEDLMKQGDAQVKIVAQNERKKKAAEFAEKRKQDNIARRAAANSPEAIEQKAANVAGLTVADPLNPLLGAAAGAGGGAAVGASIKANSKSGIYDENQLLKMLGYETPKGYTAEQTHADMDWTARGAGVDARSAGANPDKRLDGTHQDVFKALVKRSNAINIVKGSQDDSPQSRATAIIATAEALRARMAAIRTDQPDPLKRSKDDRDLLDKMTTDLDTLRPMEDRARRIRALRQKADFARNGTDTSKDLKGNGADSIKARLEMAQDSLRQQLEQRTNGEETNPRVDAARNAVANLQSQLDKETAKLHGGKAAVGKPIEGLEKAADSITKAAEKLQKTQVVGVIRDTGT